jgi:outer membrane protein assembly factor BamB
VKAAGFRAAVLALASVSCGGGSFGGPDAPTGQMSEVLRLRFRRALVSELAQTFRPTERSTPEPDPHGSRIFVGTSDASLYCVRAEDGATMWRFSTHAPIEAEPLYVREADAVYFASGDGAVYAVGATNGREKWHHDIRLLAQRRPVAAADAIYVTAGGTAVFAIDRQSGERLWAYRREAPEGFTVEGQAGIATAGRHLYTGFSDGVVAALSAIDGSVEWERDTSADVEEIEGQGAPSLDVDTTPVVVGDRIFVASIGGGVYALEKEGGGVGWRREDLRGVTGIAERGGTLYASVTSRGLVAIDTGSGETRWHAPIPGGALSPPVVHRGFAYVTSAAKGLFVVRLDDGTVVQAVEPGRGTFGAPAVLGRRVFFLSNSAVLYAMDVN